MIRSLLLLGVLVASSVAADPASDLQPARGPAKDWQSSLSRDKLKRLALAIHSYHDTMNRFPTDITDRTGKPLLSWRVAILPHLDLDFLYRQFKLDEPWDSPHNRKLAAFMPDVFRAPVQSRRAVDTYYQAIVGPGAMFDPTAKVTFESMRDPLSHTLLLVEAGPSVPWSKPADIPFDPNGKPPELTGPYTDAIYVAEADGSTFRMNPKPDAGNLRAFITRSGEEFIDPDAILRAPARKPTTEAEKRELETARESAKALLRKAAGSATDRFRVEEALRKLRAIPRPDPATVPTVQELDELMEGVQERSLADGREFYRLIEVLEKKNPKEAERIQKERYERIVKEETNRK